ncbi:restriction endonuclease [Methanobacterium sp. MZ-A1]|uniref:Restriction endonuclease n=1 Tax=Methanobacterium subterraneum TaxID=59277 RepID=A0A2H4VAW7_9EURY|nr:MULTISPECIES: restriction endonuclease [Methanobacterium]MBW4256356.1 restriction endonuclease [Methanobacterium sp. YSL]PKL72968.1 MAG: restriction endonuclease [Methanobacteriales archaeon HGW-Methanobacteriales-2]AUB55235.1 restriction endonuclease [Methanobacterium subterraneum]AUB57777.1 restriction endonuclease [Methanobacterium sp. MZ-A1]NMO09975.1 restriction endonuclease [Methanobacterium subterraneum]
MLYHHCLKVGELDKNRLVKFMARVMEESGFKVYRNFQTSRHIIDIYGVLPTILGDIGVVVACKNYDDRWEVGLDVLKEMEMVGKTLKASKIVIVTTSYFTKSAVNYADRRNIKIIDKDGLVTLAKKFSAKHEEYSGVQIYDDEEGEGTPPEVAEYTPSSETASSFPKTTSSSTGFFSRGKGSLDRATKSRSFSMPEGPGLKPLLTNTISLIIIVFALSSIITYFISMGYTNTAILGIAKILISAVLSYGLVMAIERDVTTTLSKGTIVFFVSLLIYVIMIIAL